LLSLRSKPLESFLFAKHFSAPDATGSPRKSGSPLDPFLSRFAPNRLKVFCSRNISQRLMQLARRAIGLAPKSFFKSLRSKPLESFLFAKYFSAPDATGSPRKSGSPLIQHLVFST